MIVMGSGPQQEIGQKGDTAKESKGENWGNRCPGCSRSHCPGDKGIQVPAPGAHGKLTLAPQLHQEMMETKDKKEN